MTEADRNKPLLIIVAGPNGSGKTSLTNKILAHQWFEGCTYINPDIIANEKFGDWNSREAVLAAAEFSQEERERCIKERSSLAFETVFSAADKIDFMQRAKDAGYFIRVFFVNTSDPAINAYRVAKRVMAGGHEVPIGKIISRYSKSVVNAALSIDIADRVYFYDNSIDGQDPALLFRTAYGTVSKVYEQGVMPRWAQMIKDTLSSANDDSELDAEHDGAGYKTMQE